MQKFDALYVKIMKTNYGACGDNNIQIIFSANRKARRLFGQFNLAVEDMSGVTHSIESVAII